MNITILTVTLGREHYLKKLIDSVVASDWINHRVTWYIVYQGEPSQELRDYIQEINKKNYEEKNIQKLNICLRVNKQEVQSIGAILNEFKPYCNGDIFWKLDDDALICSQNIFSHIEALYEINSNAVFSPYPVGLINNPGGVPKIRHSVGRSDKTDTFYTFRKVNHVGGFARLMPTELYKKIQFSDSHSEDTEVSAYCNANDIFMAYLENTLIVEHQESTLGQHARYGEEYFKGRF